MLIPKKELKVDFKPKTLIPKQVKKKKLRTTSALSPTMERNMLRAGVATIEEYRLKRKAWKKRKKKITQDKRALSRANRSSSSKTKFKVEKKVDMSKSRNRR